MSISTARSSRRSTESIQRKSHFKVQKNRSPPCLGSQSQQPWTRSQTTESEPSAPLFACPIAKRHPGIVSRTCLSGWSSMARVKEHLQRKHKRPPYCARCVTEFKTDNELKIHLRSEETCKLRRMPPEPDNLWLEDGIDEMLSRRSKKGEDPAETWRHIYSKLFKIADEKNIPSPYFQHLDDAQCVRERIVREFVQRLTDELRRKVDAAGTLCPTSKLKHDDVVDIINSTMDAYIKGHGARATETATSAEVNSGRSGDWDNTKLIRLSQCELSPMELEQRTSTNQHITQAQRTNIMPSTWNQPPWSSFNQRTSFRHYHLPPIEEHPQNSHPSYDESVHAYHFNDYLGTNCFDPCDTSYNTTESLEANVSISSASSEAPCWNQSTDLITFGSNDVRDNNLWRFSPWPEPQPLVISLLDE